MQIVEIKNGDISVEIHGNVEKLKSGNIVKGINTIDSFSFSILPSNIGFDLLHDLQTLVSVYNTNKNRYEFKGRVLYQSGDMSSDGNITKDVICESYLGFLCDSQQPYVEERNWTVRELFEHVLEEHNSQVEEYKCFKIGEITAAEPEDNVYIGIQRDDSWSVIKEKLISKLNAEIRLRIESDGLYLDLLDKIGETLSNPIEVAKNMQSFTRENDSTSIITRLIPYGAKLTNADGKESEERIDITSVNGGKNYIESAEATKVYGIKYGTVVFDDVTMESNLLEKGKKYLAENNKVLVKYTATALDLSLLGMEINDFDVGNYHPIKNPLLQTDDVARIIKKTIDVVEEVKSKVEIGDNIKTLSDIELEKNGNIQDVLNQIGSTKNELKDYVSETEKKIDIKFQDMDEKVNDMKNEISTLLRIESSRGTVFKNDNVSTVLSVVIYHGSKRITNNQALKELFGSGAYLQWKWQHLGDDSFGIISSGDSRFGDDGFTFTLSPDDVDTKITFMCELMV